VVHGKNFELDFLLPTLANCLPILQITDFSLALNEKLTGPFIHPDPTLEEDKKKDLNFCKYWTVSLLYSIIPMLRHTLTECTISNRGM
jgi:hypothetical protein